MLGGSPQDALSASHKKSRVIKYDVMKMSWIFDFDLPVGRADRLVERRQS